jgi:hypothetical protein
MLLPVGVVLFDISLLGYTSLNALRTAANDRCEVMLKNEHTSCSKIYRVSTFTVPATGVSSGLATMMTLIRELTCFLFHFSTEVHDIFNLFLSVHHVSWLNFKMKTMRIHSKMLNPTVWVKTE